MERSIGKVAGSDLDVKLLDICFRAPLLFPELYSPTAQHQRWWTFSFIIISLYRVTTKPMHLKIATQSLKRAKKELDLADPHQGATWDVMYRVFSLRFSSA